MSNLTTFILTTTTGSKIFNIQYPSFLTNDLEMISQEHEFLMIADGVFEANFTSISGSLLLGDIIFTPVVYQIVPTLLEDIYNLDLSVVASQTLFDTVYKVVP